MAALYIFASIAHRCARISTSHSNHSALFTRTPIQTTPQCCPSQPQPDTHLIEGIRRNLLGSERLPEHDSTRTNYRISSVFQDQTVLVKGDREWYDERQLVINKNEMIDAYLQMHIVVLLFTPASFSGTRPRASPVAATSRTCTTYIPAVCY
jgi:hypothetical protein